MKFKIQNSKFKIKEKDLKIDNLIQIILENRGIKNKKEIEEFLNPKLSNVTINNLAMDAKQLNKAVLRIKDAIKKGEKIVVFGDYDVDGICGTAILWETLNSLGAKVMPYIPHRIDEGYGLSVKGIENLKLKIENCGLILTVDNGIVANKAVGFANEQGIDVIVTDHHIPSKKLPNALAIVHTTKLCGTGVAWVLSRVILNSFQDLNKKEMLKQVQHDNEKHLELVALATVADLVPLKGANRTLLKFGLSALRKTKRVGLLELFKEAGLDKDSIGVYEIGHMIAPRLNAMGRLEYAMDSLRLICTTNPKRAEDLARILGSTNKERQELTLQSVLHASQGIRDKKQGTRKLLFISHESYEQGVIGLVAGKMVEEFYRPAIVISRGEKFSKASARSVSGFNIIEFIRTASELLVDAGGHPMAAGFTVETANLIKLQNNLEAKAELMLTEEILTRSIKIDCELPISFIDLNLYETLQKLAPFGMGNPEPTFISKGVTVDDVRLVGREGKHIKLKLSCHSEFVSESPASRQVSLRPNEMPKQVRHDKGWVDAIGFGLGEMASKIKIGDKIDVVYTIDQNEWNGNKSLQVKIRDIKTP
ncbi:MAG: single-stranded-DNA-specific exonuclease RecJ [Candidatus Levybacteria bacterium]|nr:single-stranded-DNA-specific exonuclease RecJ [Candidatus Levybacteria bacterium]